MKKAINLMGYIFILAYVVIGSIQDVYLGWLFQSKDPVVIIFFSFSIAALIFWCFKLTRMIRPPKQKFAFFGAFLKLNCIAAVNWLCFFLALKYIEPAIVGAIAFALTPSFSIILTPLLRPQKQIQRNEYVSAFGVTFGLIILVWATIAQNSSVTQTNTFNATLGILLSIIASIGMTLNTFITKGLSEKHFAATEILAYRFIGLILLTGTFLLIKGNFPAETDLKFLTQMTVIALGIVVVPMYLIQKGIESTEPVTVALLISFTPVITFLLEVFDKRLKLSTTTLTGILICTFFSIFGLISRR